MLSGEKGAVTAPFTLFGPCSNSSDILTLLPSESDMPVVEFQFIHIIYLKGVGDQSDMSYPVSSAFDVTAPVTRRGKARLFIYTNLMQYNSEDTYKST